jgi:hypothetical protein
MISFYFIVCSTILFISWRVCLLEEVALFNFPACVLLVNLSTRSVCILLNTDAGPNLNTTRDGSPHYLHLLQGVSPRGGGTIQLHGMLVAGESINERCLYSTFISWRVCLGDEVERSASSRLRAPLAASRSATSCLSRSSQDAIRPSAACSGVKNNNK